MQRLISLFFATPRRTLGWVALVLAGMLAFGLYLQNVVGLQPCPMCIVQRYCYVLVALLALLGAFFASRKAHIFTYTALLLVSAAGLFVAARQTWLQWYPPEVASRGRDFYGMIEQMPLSRAIPQIFSGSGDCSAVDWTFLGGSIANWSILCFAALIVVCFAWLFALLKNKDSQCTLLPLQ